MVYVITYNTFQFWNGGGWSFDSRDAKAYESATSRSTQDAVKKAKWGIDEADQRNVILVKSYIRCLH